MKPKVGIVILNYNNWSDTINCIDSLRLLKYDNYITIIVDNASPDDSKRHILSYLKDNLSNYNQLISNDLNGIIEANESYKYILINSDKNGGYASGNNIGIKYSLIQNCDYVMILNSDTLVTTDFLVNMITTLEKASDEIIAAGPIILDAEDDSIKQYGRRFHDKNDYWFIPPSFFWHFSKSKKRWKYINYQGEKDFWDEKSPMKIDILSGCCMLFRRKYFEIHGLFDEKTFLYAEELIIAENIKKSGKISICIPNAFVYHKGGASTSKSGRVFMVKEFMKSNEYFMKNYKSYNYFQRKIYMLGFYMFLCALKLNTLIKI